MAEACGVCGTRKGMTPFTGESFAVEHAAATLVVAGLSGWRCGACNEVVFDPESAARYAAAGDELVLQRRGWSASA